MNPKFKTKGGKEIVTFIDPVSAHVKIKFTSGGELPPELTGLFTSVRAANIAIISYLERNKEEEIAHTPTENIVEEKGTKRGKNQVREAV